MSKPKRLNFKDDFEMLYLRHEYLRRIKSLDSTMIDRYAGIVATTAKIMFNRLTNFEKVGFAIEDIISITNVYMLYYMALYSIQTNPKEMNDLLVKKGVGFLSESEILRIDRNRLISFLRQRLHHCGTLCARKARNITVGVDRRGVFAETLKTTHVSKELILEDHKKYGYRKVTVREYKEALGRAKKTGDYNLVDKNGFKMFKVEFLNNGIGEEDYRALVESYQSFSYSPPDVIMERNEEESLFDRKRRNFNELSLDDKHKMLSSFIRKNKGNKSLKKELGLAKKMLKTQNAMV